MSAQGCPGAAACPLYVLSHHAATTKLGCVHDMAEPCAGGADPAEFERLFDLAHNSIFNAWRARQRFASTEELP